MPFDSFATITYRNGKQQKREIYYGASFLSQSGRFLLIDENIASVEVTDYTGDKRLIRL